MNKIIISGNLGRQAEVRDAGSGKVISFSVAVNKKVKGEKVTTWFNCSLYRDADQTTIANYLTQGQSVIVEGEMQEPYVGKEGKASLQVRVTNVELIGGAEKTEAPAQKPTPKPSASDDLDF